MPAPRKRSSSAKPTVAKRARVPKGASCGESRDQVVAEPVLEAEAVDLGTILTGDNQTAYVWDVANDLISWEENAAGVLGLPKGTDFSSSGGFHKHIAPEHIARRTEAILDGRSDERERGVPYRVQYRFLPDGLRGNAAIWIEDFGRWWPGEDGRAAYVRGDVRVVNDHYVAAQRQYYSSDLDELTGQLTRVRLMETLSATMNVAKQQGRAGAFLVASVNNLSMINETLGFSVGDEMIVAAGRVIRTKLRQCDTVGRYASNKFGIILHDYQAGEMGEAAERLMATVRRTSVFTSACQMAVTISMGGVSFPDQVESASQAVNCSLHALECARKIRGDSFVRYEPSRMRETKRVRSMKISDEILSALEENRLTVALQPMVSATTGEPTYYECLARLGKSDGSQITPSEFIPVSEELGLARLIDLRVLEIASDLLKQHDWLRLSVNISGLTIGDPDWIGELRGLFNDDAGMAQRLVVEITETALIDDIDQALSFIDTVKELGCRVAIDDFGAGYTSFKNLKQLPVDMIKIDGSFVKNLATDVGDQVFVRAMTDLAHTFGLEIVAEWVADHESAKMLRECGVTYLQGYLYGEPFPASNLDTMRLARETG